MLDDQAPGGPGLPGFTRDGERLIINARRRAGTGPTRGSVLIAAAAWLLTLTGGGALFASFSAQYTYILAVRRQDAASVIEALLLDLLMIVFTLLALGLSRAGQSARAERALILACAAASAYMNVSAADLASPRSVAAYAVAPVALAVAVDRVVAVIRRHVLADEEPSAWTTLGRAAVAAARIVGLVLLYSLRFALAAPETARGLRRMVLDAAPLPAARRGARAGDNRAALHQESRPARPVPRPPGLRGPQQSQPGRRRAGPAGRAAGREPPAPTCTPNWIAGHHDRHPARRVLASGSQREPGRPGNAGRRPTRPDLAHQRTARPGRALRRCEPGRPVRGPGPDRRRRAGGHWTPRASRPCWIGLDRDTHATQLAELRRWVDTVLGQHYAGYELPGCWPRHIHAIWELSTLAAEWHRTYSRKHPDLTRALEFYDRWLPNTMRRITQVTRQCVPQCVMLRGAGDRAGHPRYR